MFSRIAGFVVGLLESDFTVTSMANWLRIAGFGFIAGKSRSNQCMQTKRTFYRLTNSWILPLLYKDKI